MSENKDTAVLSCEKVSKYFQETAERVTVLENINLKVAKGEQIAIMGRSGSGKTTLLQLLGGLDAPSQGQVLIKGHNLQKVNEQTRSKLRNEHLGFIYQFHHLLPEFTALENVAMPLLIAKRDWHEAYIAAKAMLIEVGLEPRLLHKPAELSGGERQRVAIARALVNNPDCLLADEPTGNLDTDSAAVVFAIMQKLNRKRATTVIVVTHDLQLATKFDKILVLKEGQLEIL